MKRIAFFTGNRADYGLLVPLMTYLQQHAPWATVQLWVGGEHVVDACSDAHVQADAWPSVYRLQQYHPAPLTWDNLTLVGAWHQQAVHYLLSQHPHPDVLIVLGDRHEALAVTLACVQAHVPVVQLAAGDVTEGGALDDRYRHAISMLACYRVAFSQQSFNNLQRMGFPSETLLSTSSLSVDNVLNEPRIPKVALFEELALDATLPTVLFTQHPLGIEGEKAADYLWQSLEAFHRYGCQVVATPPNLDGASAGLASVVERSKQAHPRTVWVEHLGRRKYLSWLAACSAVVGNTSSGLYESPLFNKPSLSIGPRQQRRERASNVVTCRYGIESVLQGLQTVLEDAAFIAHCREVASPFGTTPASPVIAQALQRLTHSGVR
ncbi:MAG: UDP-N-acetylglucosamine 2-epimerase [Vampirovibrionales bacterium]